MYVETFKWYVKNVEHSKWIRADRPDLLFITNTCMLFMNAYVSDQTNLYAKIDICSYRYFECREYIWNFW